MCKLKFPLICGNILHLYDEYVNADYEENEEVPGSSERSFGFSQANSIPPPGIFSD